MQTPQYAVHPDKEHALKQNLFNHGVTEAEIQAAGGVGGFVQKLIDGVANLKTAHPFLYNLALGALNRWLATMGLPAIPA